MATQDPKQLITLLKAAELPHQQTAKILADAYQVPHDVAANLIQGESGWNPEARGKLDEIGLTQLRPMTAKSLGVDPKDPVENMAGGLAYLRQQKDRFGNWGDANRAYKYGPEKWQRKMRERESAGQSDIQWTDFNGKKVGGGSKILEALQLADADMRADGLPGVNVSSSFRTTEEQQRLFDELSPKGARVAKPGTSRHERGEAIDVHNWQEAQPYLERYGLSNPISDDRVHFQFSDGDQERPRGQRQRRPRYTLDELADMAGITALERRKAGLPPAESARGVPENGDATMDTLGKMYEAGQNAPNQDAAAIAYDLARQQPQQQAGAAGQKREYTLDDLPMLAEAAGIPLSKLKRAKPPGFVAQLFGAGKQRDASNVAPEPNYMGAEADWGRPESLGQPSRATTPQQGITPTQTPGAPASGMVQPVAPPVQHYDIPKPWRDSVTQFLAKSNLDTSEDNIQKVYGRIQGAPKVFKAPQISMKGLTGPGSEPQMPGAMPTAPTTEGFQRQAQAAHEAQPIIQGARQDLKDIRGIMDETFQAFKSEPSRPIGQTWEGTKASVKNRLQGLRDYAKYIGTRQPEVGSNEREQGFYGDIAKPGVGSDFYKNASQAIGKIADKIELDPEYVNTRGFIEDVTRGLGQQAINVVSYLAARGLMRAPLAVGNAVVQRAILSNAPEAAGMVASMGGMAFEIIGAQVEELKSKGVPEDRAVAASLLSAGSQIPLESLGLGKIIDSMGAVAGKRIAALVGSMLTEGTTEFLQKFEEQATNIWAENPNASVGDLVTKFIDSLPQTAKEGAYEGLIASVTSGGMTAIGQAVSAATGRGRQILEPEVMPDTAPFQLPPPDRGFTMRDAEEPKGFTMREGDQGQLPPPDRGFTLREPGGPVPGRPEIPGPDERLQIEAPKTRLRKGPETYPRGQSYVAGQEYDVPVEERSRQEPAYPERHETLALQTQALEAGDIPVVMFPPLTPKESIPDLPKGMKRWVVTGDVPGAGVYYYNPEVVKRTEIDAAAKEGTHNTLLGIVQTKREAMANGQPIALQAVHAETGIPLQDVVVDGTNQQAIEKQAQILQERFPNAVIQASQPGDVIADRMEGTPPESIEGVQPEKVKEKGKTSPSIGDKISFIRYGEPTENSTDWSTGQPLNGMSVYSLNPDGSAQQTVRSEFADRKKVYIGEGTVSGFGSDGEPLVTDFNVRPATKLEDEKAYYGGISRKEWLRKRGYDEAGNKVPPRAYRTTPTPQTGQMRPMGTEQPAVPPVRNYLEEMKGRADEQYAGWKGREESDQVQGQAAPPVAFSEAQLKAMRSIRSKSDAYRAKGDELAPKGNQIPTGSEHTSHYVKGDSLATFLREISKGKTIDEALVAAKEDARSMLKSWNDMRTKDIHSQLAESHADAILEDAARTMRSLGEKKAPSAIQAEQGPRLQKDVDRETAEGLRKELEERRKQEAEVEEQESAPEQSKPEPWYDDRAMNAITRVPSFEDRMDSSPSKEEAKALKDGGFTHAYFSPNRPHQPMYDREAEIRGRFLYTKDPLSMDEIVNRELIPDSRTDQAQLAIDYYRQQHGDKPMVFYKEDETASRWRGAVIAPSTKQDGKWQVTWFDKDGFSGDVQHDSQVEAVKDALVDGFKQFEPDLLDQAMKHDSFHEGNAKTREVEKFNQESYERAQERQKQPWEMPLKEYSKLERDNIESGLRHEIETSLPSQMERGRHKERKEYRDRRREQVLGLIEKRKAELEDIDGTVKKYHEGEIRLAISQGKSIPDEVLVDYPDLQQVSEPPVPTSRIEAAKIKRAALAAQPKTTIPLSAQKAGVLKNIDEAIKAAKHKQPPEYDQINHPVSGKMSNVPTHRVSIDIPGDGSVLVGNDKQSLTRLREIVKKTFPTSLPKGIEKKGGGGAVTEGRIHGRLAGDVDYFQDYEPKKVDAQKGLVSKETPELKLTEDGMVTNGHMAMVEPKLAASIAPETPRGPSTTKVYDGKKLSPATFESVSHYGINGGKKAFPAVAVASDKGRAFLQAKYVDAVMTEHPKAKPFMFGGKEHPVVFKDPSGKAVGVVFPVIQTDEVSAWYKRMLKQVGEGGEKVVEASPTPAKEAVAKEARRAKKAEKEAEQPATPTSLEADRDIAGLPPVKRYMAISERYPEMTHEQILEHRKALKEAFPNEPAPVEEAPATSDRAKDVSRPDKAKLRASKLRKIAEDLKAKADEDLSKDRLANTPKRARQAASSIEDANKQIQLARTISNIADAIESGESELLSRIRSKAQIEQLDTILRRAKYAEMSKNYPDSYERSKHEGEPITEKTVEFIEDPLYKIHRDRLVDFINEAKKVNGLKRQAGKWETKLKGRMGEYYSPSVEDMNDLSSMAAQMKLASWSPVGNAIKEWNRLQAMGISGKGSLQNMLRDYLKHRGDKPKIDKSRELELGMVGKKVGIDFFPTPKNVAADMVERAGVKPGMRVLEPSAGSGNIAEAIKDAGVDPDAVEVSQQLRDLLEAKGINLVGRDFMDLQKGNEGYDRIIMNPPFSNNQDIEHVRHAYDLLNPGGKIVAIMGEGAFFRTGKTETAFREWLDEVGGTEEKLPTGTFKDKTLLATTGVNARLVEIEKPAEVNLANQITEAAQGPLKDYETQLAENPAKNVTIPEGKRITIENDLYSETLKHTGKMGGAVTQTGAGKIGRSIFEVERPYGKLIYNEATGELAVEEKPFVLDSAVRKDVKFGVDKTLLLQTISKDIVNNDLAGTIANETIQNSLDAFPKKQQSKKIEIEITSDIADFETPGNDLDGLYRVMITRVRVADNGVGMTAKEVEKHLLRLGAKGKTGTDSRGGYGLAKAGFLLTPIRARVETVKDGVKTTLEGTREQFFGVKGAGDPTLSTETYYGQNTGTEFTMEFYSYEEDAAKVNAFNLSPYAADAAFKKYAENGIFMKDVEIDFNPSWGSGLNVKSKPLAEEAQVFPPEKLEVKGNKLTVYFLNDPNPEGKAWDGKYYPRQSIFNKGLALFGIQRGFQTNGLLDQPAWQIRVDFDSTTDVRSIDYPFIRNRTALNDDIRNAVQLALNQRIDEINLNAFSGKKADFLSMVENSPEIGGVKVMIPFTDQNDFDKAKDLVEQNRGMVEDLADIFVSFKHLLGKIGEKSINLALTVDPKVHGFRAIPETTGHDFYAINPFAITTDFEATDLYKELVGADYDSEMAQASNLVHTLVHEFAHNRATRHDESFSSEVARLYNKMTHVQLARLEGEAREFYGKNGEVLRGLQDQFAEMATSKSQFRQDRVVVPAPGGQQGRGGDGQGVQGVRKEGVVGREAVRDPLASQLGAVRTPKAMQGSVAQDITQQTTDAVTQSLRATAADIKAAWPALKELGRRAYHGSEGEGPAGKGGFEGAKDYASWFQRMKGWLGDQFGKFRDALRKVWKEVSKPISNQSGAIRVPQSLKTVAANMGEALDEFKKVLHPSSRGPIAGESARSLREHLAERARQYDIAEAALKKAEKFFDSQDKASNMAFINTIETGTPTGNADLDAIAKTIRDLFDERVAKVRALGTGKLQHVIQDYFPHIWKDPKKAASVYASYFGTRPMEGGKAFLKKRSIPTTADGLAQGLEPISENPVTLTLMKVREMDKYLSAHRFLNEAKARGYAQFVRSTSKGPDGWVKVQDPMGTVYGQHEKLKPWVVEWFDYGHGKDRSAQFETKDQAMEFFDELEKQQQGNVNIRKTTQGQVNILGSYYMPEEAAKVLNNYLSPGLRGSKLFRGYLGVANWMNQAQLGLSFFHLGFTSLDAIISQVGKGIIQTSKGKVGGAAKSFATAIGAPISNALRGNKILKEWYSPGSQSPEIQEIVQGVVAGGGRARMDNFYHSRVTENMMKAFRQGRILEGVLRLPFSALEATAKPVLEYIVPRQKLGVFADLMRMELDRNPGMSHDELRVKASKIWDSVDNRMGQLVYDNLFWNKVAKDLGMASVRSLGWNVGTIREVVGGVKDFAVEGKKLLTPGKRSEVTYRMSYVIALPLVVGTLGALTHFLYTGEPPEEPRDYFFPKTGGKDEKGRDERVSFPSYMKDLYHYKKDPLQTISNKMHPAVSMVSDMLRNKDYYGTEIRNADDPWVKQVTDTMKYAGKTALPFSIRNIMREQELHGDDAMGTQALNFIGITPAPGSVKNTPAMQKMDDISKYKVRELRTEEQAEKAQAKSDLLKVYDRGEVGKFREKMDEAILEGKITKKEARELMDLAELHPLQRRFKGLSLQEALDVFSLANQEERAVIGDQMQSKIKNTYLRNPENYEKERSKVEKVLSEIKESGGGKSIMETDKAIIRHDLIEQGRSGDTAGMKREAIKAIKEGIITEREAESIVKESKLTEHQSRFKRTPLESAVNDYVRMTEAEKDAVAQIFEEKLNNYYDRDEAGFNKRIRPILKREGIIADLKRRVAPRRTAVGQ